MDIEKCKKVNRGSSTIETALIISAVLLILAALIYSFLIMHQKLLLTKAAEQVAGQAAVIWGDSSRSIYDGSIKGGKKDISMRELYYQLFDDYMLIGKKISEKLDVTAMQQEETETENTGSGEEKFMKMKKAICAELSKSLMKPSSTYLDIDFSNILVQRKISIRITQKIKIPLGWIKGMVDGKDYLTLAGEGIAVITEPGEHIRTVDFMLEYISGSGVVSDIGDKIDDLKDKLEIVGP